MSAKPCINTKWRLLTAAFISFSLILSPLYSVTAENNPAALTQKTLRIGHLTDLTGIGAMLGVQSSFGVAMAAEELRQSGRDIQVFTGDHQMKLGQVVTETKKLLDVNQVQAIIADLNNPSLAAIGTVESAKKLFVSISPSEEIVSKHSGAFRSFLDYRDGCLSLGRYFKTSGKISGYLGVLSEFGELCLDSLIQDNPNLIVERFNSGDDLRSALLRLKNKGAQQVALIGFEQDLISAVKRTAELKLNFIFGFPTLYLTPLVKQTLSETLKGSLVFGFAPIEEDFVNKVRSRDPGRDLQNIEFAALGYMHTYHLAYAFEACPNQELSCIEQKFENAYREEQRSPNLVAFRGWEKKLAKFDMFLYRRNGQALEKVKE